MVRQASKFRQRDLTRTIRAAVAAGVEVESIEIDSEGKIVAHLRGTGGDNPKTNSADAVLEKLRKHEHGKS
jgi:hypothetical protein